MKTGKKIKAVISEGGPGDEEKKEKKGSSGKLKFRRTKMSKEERQEYKYKTKLGRKLKRAKKRGINPEWVKAKFEKKKKEKDYKRSEKERKQAEWDAMTAEEKKRATETTRSQKKGRVKKFFREKLGIGTQQSKDKKKQKKRRHEGQGGGFTCTGVVCDG